MAYTTFQGEKLLKLTWINNHVKCIKSFGEHKKLLYICGVKNTQKNNPLP